MSDKRAIERARKEFRKERRRRRVRSLRARLVHFKEYVLGFPWVVQELFASEKFWGLWHELWEERHWSRATIAK